MSNNSFLEVDGSYAVWQSTLDRVGTEFFFYNGDTGEVKQLTNSSTDIHNFKGLGGSTVFWQNIGINGDYWYAYNDKTKRQTQLNTNPGSSEAPPPSVSGLLEDSSNAAYGIGDQVFFYNGETESITKVSQVGAVKEIQGNYLTWFIGTDLYLFNAITGQSSRLSGDDGVTFLRGMDGSNVVWSGNGGSVPERLFFTNGTGSPKPLISGLSASNGQFFVQLSGSNVVWSENDGTDREYFFYNGTTGKTTQLTGLTGNPDDDKINDDFLGMEGTRVFWKTGSKTFVYDDATGNTTQLSNVGAIVKGSNAYWVDSNQLFLYDGGRSKTLSLGTLQFTPRGFVGDGDDMSIVFNESSLYQIKTEETFQTPLIPNGNNFKLPWNNLQAIENRNLIFEYFDGGTGDIELFLYKLDG